MVENTNNLILTGKIVGAELSYSLEKEHNKQDFYKLMVSVNRLSDIYDTLPVIVSSKLLYGIDTDTLIDRYVKISGNICTRNYTDEQHKNRLQVFAFARDLEFIEYEDGLFDTNEVELTGYVCREPHYRETKSKRHVTDILIACNRKRYRKNGRDVNKAAYIPCICWGINARFASKLMVGDKVALTGRFQPRKYTTRDGEERIVHEVSVQDIGLDEEDIQDYTAVEKVI